MDDATRELATRWQRLGGALIDSLVSMLAVVPVMLGTGTFAAIRESGGLTVGQTVAFLVYGWVVFLAINGYFLAKSGQTVGKLVVGTQIVSYHNGDLLPLGKILLLRVLPVSLVAHVPVIGQLLSLLNVLFIFGAEKRCIHDLIAGSMVVKMEATEPF